MSEIVRKTYRVSKDLDGKIKELLKIYEVKSENELIEKVINDIYKLKHSKALVPYEELDKKDAEMKRLYFELGKLKTQLEEREKELERERNKSFWARLFGK